MSERKIPDSGYSSETKNKILDESTKLFALRGFNAVSVRDIATAVGIKTSSLYNYYESKDALLEDILVRFEKGYWHYLNWLSNENMKANSLEEIIDNMINKEIIEMNDPMGSLGISLILKEQHNNASVRKRVFELFWGHCIKSIQNDFDRLAEQGVIDKSNTRMVAILLVFCIFAVNDLRLHEFADAKPPVDHTEIYSGLKKVLASVFAQGQGHSHGCCNPCGDETRVAS